MTPREANKGAFVCKNCGSGKTRVVDSRKLRKRVGTYTYGGVHRRRVCFDCDTSCNTLELREDVLFGKGTSVFGLKAELADKLDILARLSAEATAAIASARHWIDQEEEGEENDAPKKKSK